MLKILKYETRSQIADFFSTQEPSQCTWLVSDLRTKFELQQRLLQKQGHYLDESVLRASDLWKLLLRRLEPQLREASDSFIRSLLKSFLDEYSEQLGVNASAEESVFAYMNLLNSVHLHPDGEERLREWFLENPESATRWQEWALRSRAALFSILNQGVISLKWVAPYLQKFNHLEQVWGKNLIVDLGGEISRVEADLLRALSRHVDVVVLQPTPGWGKDFSYLLKPYEDLSVQAQEVSTLPSVPPSPAHQKVLRFSGMLAEVKDAVGRVRSWLDQGIAAEEITVVAPDIEAYWPVLQAFLEKEGIPANKDVNSKVQGLPSMVRWLSLLRSQSGRLAASDIEAAFYGGESSQNLRYEQFRSLFTSIYAEEDLNRDEWVQKKILSRKIKSDDFLLRDDFVQLCMIEWTGNDNEAIQMVLRELLKNAKEQTKLKWKEWLGYLENVVAMREYVVSKGQPQGVMVTKLMSAHSSKFKYRIFMGLAEENFKTKSKVKLMSQDYYRIAQDIGFYLENPEQKDLEFELRMLTDTHSLEDVFSFGATDLLGSLLSPCSYWVELKSRHEGMENLEDVLPPAETRWDELQKSSLPPLAGLTYDLGAAPRPHLQLPSLPRISASAMENFLKCPFIFAAQKYFRLMDLPDIDLDMDHRTRGRLAHALFEKLTAEPMRYDWTDAEIEKFLEEARQAENMIFADERLWTPFKKKHLQIAQRFLRHEKNWRAQWTKTFTLGREKKFEFYFDVQTGALSLQPQEGHFRIAGQIDRIDTDREGHLVLLDYKSSMASAYTPAKWLPDSRIQLLMYMWVIEKEMIADVRGEVIGLFYYVFKNFERKGFRLDEKSGLLYPPPKRKSKGYDEGTKQVYLEGFYELLLSTLRRIASGEINPEPADRNDCKKCEWRRLCRAPHLN